MKKILVAPDSFKGSVSAIEFCQLAADALADRAEIDVIQRPMSDGGEGFVDALLYSGQATEKWVSAFDPLGRPVQAKFGWQADTQTAIIEMAQASGLPRLTESELNPLFTSTYGTGQVIQSAIDLGAKKIVIGLGGSATNDAGVGALQALGFGFLNQMGQEIQVKHGLGGGDLLKITKIIEKRPGLVDFLNNINWVLACDVINPMVGKEGATTVFGAQKGVSKDNFAQLEEGIEQFSELIKITFGRDVATLPGAGAAGAMAGGFVGVLNAKIVSGFDLLADILSLEKLMQTEDILCVITGEGTIDIQTGQGKLPSKIAHLAQKYQIPVLGLCGKLAINPKELPEFTHLKSIHPPHFSNRPLTQLKAKTPQNLKKAILEGVKLMDFLPVD